MTLGERLRAARKHAGLTQVELETKSGVPQQTISKIERGDADTSAFVVRLAVACGVRPEWLDMESGSMVSEEISEDARKIARSYDLLAEEKKAAYRVLLGQDVEHKDDEQCAPGAQPARYVA